MGLRFHESNNRMRGKGPERVRTISVGADARVREEAEKRVRESGLDKERSENDARLFRGQKGRLVDICRKLHRKNVDFGTRIAECDRALQRVTDDNLALRADNVALKMRVDLAGRTKQFGVCEALGILWRALWRNLWKGGAK